MKVVTITPPPALAQECLNTAITQMELTSCAALEAQFASEKLDQTIARIEFSPEERRTFDHLQEEWQKQVLADCEFFYGQLGKDSEGNQYYKGGIMAPMQRNFCVAERYKERIKELEVVYLTPN